MTGRTGMPRLRWIHDGADEAAFHLILCHGFGANASDLRGVAPLIDPEGSFSFHFPEAPYPIFPDARAWFPSDPEELGDALSGELWRNLPDYDSPAMDDSLSALLDDIDALGIPSEDLVIGGFSQGSMMALLASLSRPCAAAILLSSALFSRKRLRSLLSGAARPPVFMGHGLHDRVLPWNAGQALGNFLSTAGLEVEFHSFEGEHWIDEEEARALRAFLGKLRI
jgi:phospholipase/carboxylesterase